MRRIDIGEQVRVAAGAHPAEPRGFFGRVLAKRGDCVQVSTGSYGGRDHGLWVDIADVTQGPASNPSRYRGREARADLEKSWAAGSVQMFEIIDGVLADHVENKKHARELLANEVMQKLLDAGFHRDR